MKYTIENQYCVICVYTARYARPGNAAAFVQYLSFDKIRISRDLSLLPCLGQYLPSPLTFLLQ